MNRPGKRAAPVACGASDDELVRRFQAGDEAAYVAFVERHQDRVFRMCLALLGDADDAADAAQEVFVRSLGGLQGFGFRAAPLTWLTRVVRNVCSESLRRGRRLERGVDLDTLVAPEGHVAPAPADARRLQGWLRALPARQQQVVALRMLEELSVKETAVLMGCRPGTVKALLFKAMQKLKAMAQ